jgi:hypothetical protein
MKTKYYYKNVKKLPDKKDTYCSSYVNLINFCFDNEEKKTIKKYMVEYRLGKTSKPRVIGTKLFVCETEESAKKVDSKGIVFKCAVKNPKKIYNDFGVLPLEWGRFWKNFRPKKSNYYDGSVIIADEITLIEKVI